MSENYLDLHSATLRERDCNITLRQALDKYYAQNPDFYKPDQFEDSYNKILFAHDACHIVFGCDTNVVGEAKLEVWTLFATNLDFKTYYDDYVSPLLAAGKNALNGDSVANEGFKEASRIFLTLPNLIQYVLASFSFVKVFLMTRKVNPKWHYYNYHGHLDRSILDIRKEFNIQIL
jgi:hypothetical protein